MDVIDLFGGTGGYSHGVCHALGERSRVVYGIDMLEVATQTFALNHHDAKVVCGDIREWDPERVEDELGIHKADLIVGGPPCQGFSSLRPNRSTNNDDARNGLYMDFVRYVEHFQPRAFVMENVNGLATHEGGRLIERIEAAFHKAGYTADWRLVNAANYGVPQRRERLIMVGARDDITPAFPLPTHRSAGSTIGLQDKSRVIPEVDIREPIRRLQPAVTTWDAISDLPAVKSGQGATRYATKPQNEFQAHAREGAGATVSMHEATRHTEKMLEIIRHSGPNIYSLPPGMVTSGFSSCYSRLEADLPATTVTVNFVHPASNKCIHPFQDRALTPREGARLQSFPDTYRFAGSRTQIVKQIGNAVPPLLGEAIGRMVRAMLEGQAGDCRVPVVA